MLFVDLLMWVCALFFLTGLICIFEIKLSSVFGFSLLLVTNICFAAHFWVDGMPIFGIMFAVSAIFSIRFLIGSIVWHRKNR